MLLPHFYTLWLRAAQSKHGLAAVRSGRGGPLAGAHIYVNIRLTSSSAMNQL